LALLFGALAIPLSAQTQSQCAVSSGPPLIRAEGLTERLGDILLQCSFGSSPATLSGNLVVYLPAPVTNRVDSNGVALDALLLADSGGGFVPSGVPGLVASQSISFNGINLAVPASGKLNLKVSSIRVAANQLASPVPQPITAWLSFTVPLTQSQVVAGYAEKSLYATVYDTGISCLGSPLPASLSLTNLFAAGTTFASTRFTEAFGGAFQPRGAGDDNGTRLIVRYSGLPAGTLLILPDFVAGSDAQVPTSGGDLGTVQAVGQYVPGSGTLLLARVALSDSSGTGGVAMALPQGAGGGPLLLDSASTVPLTNGAGYAVYEVMDGNSSALESVQFPTFIGLPTVTASAVAQETVSYAPVASVPPVPAASQTAPVPRFIATEPTSDCSFVGDCQAGYFPKLGVSTTQTFQTTVTAGGATTEVPGAIYIGNTGGGILNWAIAINYVNGSGWLLLDVSSGQNDATVRVWAQPQNLTAGTYTANLVVRAAGPLSTPVTIPVTVIVQPAPPPPPPTPVVTSVINAATLTVTSLVAGSLGTVMGSNLSGKNVAVTIDGAAATLLYTSATQINLQVPASLDPSETSAALVVTVDGASSGPVTVSLAPAGPSIFNGGALNQDSSPNAPASAAAAGSMLQIFATGIPASALVSVQIGSQGNLTPEYAGPAPGITGVQQVNVAVPSGLPSGATPLEICAVVGSQQFCSNSFTVYLQ
jgi:uncharacterized protein (TIGR03437 family)